MNVTAFIDAITPFVIPFVIGVLSGAIIRRAAKLALLATGLFIMLSTAGYVNLSVKEIYDQVLLKFPQIIEVGEGLKNNLPYSSTTFLVGLALGLWKG